MVRRHPALALSLAIFLGTASYTAARAAHAGPVPVAKKPVASFLVQFGTASNEYATNGAVDSKGNVYVVGSTNGDMDGAGPGIRRGTDAYIAKYSSSGRLRWVTQFAAGVSSVSDIAVGADDSLYVVGYVSGDIDGNGPQKFGGLLDGFVAKYSAAGKRVWVRMLGGVQADSLNGVAVAGRNVYVVGDTANSLGDGGQAFIGGTSDIVVARYTTAGVRKWVRQLGTASMEAAADIAVGARGTLFFVGSTQGDIDGPGVGTFNMGLSDAFIGSMKPDGTLRWATQVGSLQADAGNAVVVDSTGNPYLVGSAQSDMDGGLRRATHYGLMDAFIMKFTAAGTQKWVTQLGTATTDIATTASIDAKNRIFLAGTTAGELNGTFPEIYAGFTDGWVARLSSAGRLQWMYQFGGPGVDTPSSVMVSRGGAVYAAGHTSGDIDGVWGSQVSAGQSDAFLLKVTPDGEFIAAS